MLTAEDLRVAIETDTDTDAGLVRAIDGLALALARGETFALVGESGCGKSMTALALMRLLPDAARITAGTVRLEEPEGGGTSAGAVKNAADATKATKAAAAVGTDLLALPEAAMRAVRGGRIGMIFQEPATSLNPVVRVGDQIVEAIEAHIPLRGRAARARAVEWLRRVGIPEPERRIDDYPFRLSGGQKQRVMIAMTLAAEPEYLIADEPTTALDVTIQAQILDLLAELQRERGLGLLLITHDLAVVSGMAHRVALMYAGQIVEVASARDFFAAPKHPYARRLLAALPGAGRRGEPLAAIPGSVPPLSESFAGCRFAPRCDRVFADCRVTPPPLYDTGNGHLARCLLYRPEGESTGAGVSDATTVEVPVPVRASAPEPAAPAPPAPPAMLIPTRTPTPTPTTMTASSATGTNASAHPVPSPLQVQLHPRPYLQPQPQLPTAASPLLEVESLRVRFPIHRGVLQRVVGHVEAVREVSFSIGRGRTLALVGESGCGKSTVARAIVQLLRGQAEISGSARLDGRDLFTLQGRDLREARREVQIVFQDPYASLDPRMRVAEALEEGLLALRPELDAAARRAAAAEALAQVGLGPEALERHPHEFSGGQRQRIAIARALAVRPRLIVCDEPTSALDVSVQAQILNLLLELQHGLGVSYLFITHNIGVVEYLADEVAVMREGRIEEAGPADAVLGAPRADYTRSLLAAVPRLAVAGVA